MNYKYLFINLFIILCLSLNFTNVKAQILDVPYRNDMTGCGNWCWAMSDQMIINYYGNNVQLCDVLEFARQRDTTYFGSVNCCENPWEKCCKTGLVSANESIINHWSISNTLVYHPLSIAEIQSDIQNKRPFIIHLINFSFTKAHDVLAYGINNNDIYIHNPGNGSEIRDYNDLINNTDKPWMRTNRMNVSPGSCLQTLTISGTINNATSTYKALNSINANCVIDSSNVVFKSNGLVELGPGFNVQTGSSFSVQNGNVSCP
ncbi:MAG: papain-like cysteine protease family protein [Candidatus Saccharibacteria bacterium]